MHACVADATANDSETSFPKYVQSHRIHASCMTHTHTHIHGHTPFYTGERPSVLRFCSVFLSNRTRSDQLSREIFTCVLFHYVFDTFARLVIRIAWRDAAEERRGEELRREDGHASEKKEERAYPYTRTHVHRSLN